MGGRAASVAGLEAAAREVNTRGRFSLSIINYFLVILMSFLFTQVLLFVLFFCIVLLSLFVMFVLSVLSDIIYIFNFFLFL